LAVNYKEPAKEQLETWKCNKWYSTLLLSHSKLYRGSSRV